MPNITTSKNGFTIDGEEFVVLINKENQHSIWPSKKAIPEGWSSLGFIGSKENCSKYIDEKWIDLRPLSLQKL